MFLEGLRGWGGEGRGSVIIPHIPVIDPITASDPASPFFSQKSAIISPFLGGKCEEVGGEVGGGSRLCTGSGYDNDFQPVLVATIDRGPKPPNARDHASATLAEPPEERWSAVR